MYTQLIFLNFSIVDISGHQELAYRVINCGPEGTAAIDYTRLGASIISQLQLAMSRNIAEALSPITAMTFHRMSQTSSAGSGSGEAASGVTVVDISDVNVQPSCLKELCQLIVLSID